MTDLPRLLVLSDGRQAEAAGRPLRSVLVDAVAAGLRAVVVRERHLPVDERRRLVRWTEDLLGEVGGLVVVAAPALEPHHNVHLPAAAPAPVARPAVTGRSCHDRAEVGRAAAEGCDYATLSPIFPSPSKPGYGPPLGTASLVDAPLALYALGGITVENAAACIDGGAGGVAVMGTVMRARDVRDVVAGLVAAVGDGA